MINQAGIGNTEQKNHIEIGGALDSSMIQLLQPQLSIQFNKKEDLVTCPVSLIQKQMPSSFQDKQFISIACPIILQNDIQNHMTAFWHSKAILLSQVINYRLNLPRVNERAFHSDYVKQVVAMTFQIENWQELINQEQLYEMSLTGHLIRSIQSEGGTTTLQNLIFITEPFLPYLRKLSGKNFTGTTGRTVKGCLSAVVFKREGENQWSINESKVNDFISQANEKLAMFFEKLKRNFPKFEEVRVYSQNRKKGMKKQKIQSSCKDRISQKIAMKQKQLHQLLQGQNLNFTQPDKMVDYNIISQAEKIIQEQHQLRLELEHQDDELKEEDQKVFNGNAVFVQPQQSQSNDEIKKQEIIQEIIRHKYLEYQNDEDNSRINMIEIFIFSCIIISLGIACQ